MDFMFEAIKEAYKAKKKDEVPIGAVIVIGDEIISKAYNKREKTNNALAHAEIIAINKACKKLKSWRLEGADIYVTLEPCPMCAGAIANARINRIIYAARETSSNSNLCEKILKDTRLNHKVQILKDDTHEKEARMLLSNFFKEKRTNK